MPKGKTIHELSKEFPEKTYKELEKYREEDRQQEAGACIMGEMRKDREKPTEVKVTYSEDISDIDKLKKRAQEAEGELSIMKGIETNRVKEAQARCDHLQNELDRVKKENNDLFNRVADALEVNESHQKLNGKLQERLTELEQNNIELHAENKRMHNHLNKQLENARKSGM